MATQNRTPAALKTRVYCVNGEGHPPRLIEASSLERASAFVGGIIVHARVASQIDMYSAGAAHVEIEDAESLHPCRLTIGASETMRSSAAQTRV